MTEILRSILSNFLFFFLHLSNGSSFPKPLPAEEEKRLLYQMKNHSDVKAREKLIEHNLRLVSHIVKKYYSDYNEQEDLISVGTMGLIKGIDSFKAEKGVKLATYVSRCIENEIFMYFRSKKKDAVLLSIEEPLESDSNGNPLTLMDILSTEYDFDEQITLKQQIKQLYQFIEELPDEREKEIIIRRYGLYNKKEMTQREIAALMGISRSYVSRIEKKVINQLREKFAEY